MTLKTLLSPVAIGLLFLSSQLVSCKKYENPVTPIPRIDNISVNASGSESTTDTLTVGAPLTIKGSNFSTTPSENTVKFNGVQAVVIAATSTQLTTEVPADATTGKISITVAGRTTISEKDFVVNSAPLVIISSFSPASGFPQQEGDIGTTVRITGDNFSTVLSPNPAANLVKFNGIPAIVVNATKTVIMAIVPAGALPGKISVTVNGVTATSENIFIVNSTLDIFITGWRSTCSDFMIMGNNFSLIPSENEVKFNGTSAIVTASTKTQVTTTLPQNATTGRVTITVKGHTGTSPADIVIPTLRTFSPAAGSTGTSVTLNGENIAGFQYTDKNSLCHEVKFNGINAVITDLNENQITVIVPAGATNGKITISGNGRTATSVSDFNVVSPPKINLFSPASGNVGTQVTISGADFIPNPSANEVKFNGVQAVVTQATSTQLIVEVPINAASGKISVNNIGGNVSSESDFTIIQPSFTFSPQAGPEGLIVTLTGSGFNSSPANNIVKFNGIPALVTDASATQLKVIVPFDATNGRISLTTNGNTVTSVSDFVVVKPPAFLLNIQPTSGSADRPGVPGTRVVINGSNFSQLPFQNMIRFGTGPMVPAMFSTRERIEVIIPAGSTSGQVVVFVNNVPSVGNVLFTVVP